MDVITNTSMERYRDVLDTMLTRGVFGRSDDEKPVCAVLCGKTFEVGEKVTLLLKPEIEVIHFINSFEDAKDNLGELLAGRGPKQSCKSNHIGSHNYSQLPRAVIFGRAFAEGEVNELNRLYRSTSSVPVAWIAGEESIVPPPQPGPGYAEAGAENVKRAFERWREAGAKSDVIVYY
ncbi:hypothetical protein LTR27_003439 [Elasticomyces elasticus]|nr:hypothetical protein LTR27_003439 [Elasticomyces elasticus]